MSEGKGSMDRKELRNGGRRSQPVWFGPQDSPLFGLVDSPDGPVRGGVVLCPSLGLEHISAYGTYRELALHLERVGFAVLRFDYHSTGDSFDPPDGAAGDSGGFVDDVRIAVEFVRSMGANRVAMIGMRMGALLACAQCVQDPLDSLVLWDPCPTGHSFLREQRMLSLLASGRADDGNTGDIEMGGFRISAARSSEISGLSLAHIEGPLANKVLLLTRTQRPVDSELCALIERIPVEHRQVTGQPELLDVPSPTVPSETLETITTWLEQTMPRLHPAVKVPTRRAVMTGRSFIDLHLQRRVGSPGENALTERGMLLGPNGLFGIECEPTRGSMGPACLFVSVAWGHRIGPQRMWVDLSRRLAAYGFRCVRLDLGGVGESRHRDGDPAQPVFSMSGTEDVINAVKALSPQDPSNVVLFGSCASAYHVLEASWRISPRGVCVLNPSVCPRPPEMAAGGAMDCHRYFCIPESTMDTILRRATSFLLLEQCFSLLRRLQERYPIRTLQARRALRVALRSMEGRWPESWRSRTRAGSTICRPGERLVDLSASGTDVLVISGAADISPFVRTGAPLVQPMTDSRRLRIEVIPGLGHQIADTKDQDTFADLIVEHVVGRFGHNAT